MKFTRFEKTMICLILLLVSYAFFLTYRLSKSIESSGGIRQVIVEAGKEIKAIKKEIDSGK